MRTVAFSKAASYTFQTVVLEAGKVPHGIWPTVNRQPKKIGGKSNLANLQFQQLLPTPSAPGFVFTDNGTEMWKMIQNFSKLFPESSIWSKLRETPHGTLINLSGMMLVFQYNQSKNEIERVVEFMGNASCRESPENTMEMKDSNISITCTVRDVVGEGAGKTRELKKSFAQYIQGPQLEDYEQCLQKAVENPGNDLAERLANIRL